MPILITLLQGFVLWLFLWVGLFRLGTTLELSVRVVGLSFFVGVVLALPFFLRALKASWQRSHKQEMRFCVTVLAMGLCLSVPVLLMSRPDADDVGYMNQYLIDTSNLDAPFTQSYFGLPFGGEFYFVPGLAEHEAYEAMLATSSALLGLDTLGLYHNGLPVLLCLAWATTYALLLRRFRFGRTATLVGVAAAAAFLFLDGNVHVSHGNMSFLRIWQGKVVAISILLPAFLLFSLRFLACPRKRRGALLFALALTMAAINRSMLLVIPVVAVSIVVAWGLGYRRLRRRNWRSLVGFAPVLLAAAAALGGVFLAARGFFTGSEVSDALGAMKEWRTFSGHRFPDPWWQRLYIQIADSPWVVGRDLWLVLVAPWLVCSKPQRRFIPLMALVALLISYSPWAGALWYFLVEEVFFRFYYALSLALVAGMAGGAFVRVLKKVGDEGRLLLRPLIGALGTVIAIGLAVQVPVWSKANQVSLKSPLAYRLDPVSAELARKFTPLVLGQRVLAPNVLATYWAVTLPTEIDLLTARWMTDWSVSPDRYLTKCHRGRGEFLSYLLSTRPPPSDIIILNRCKDSVVREFAGYGYELEPMHPLDPEGLTDFAAYAIVTRPP